MGESKMRGEHDNARRHRVNRAYRTGGSDGGQSREYKLPDTHFAVAIPVTLVRPPQQQPQLDSALWSAIAERARYESLRDLAVEYGVSHETIRSILRRVAAQRREDRIA